MRGRRSCASCTLGAFNCTDNTGKLLGSSARAKHQSTNHKAQQDLHIANLATRGHTNCSKTTLNKTRFFPRNGAQDTVCLREPSLNNTGLQPQQRRAGHAAGHTLFHQNWLQQADCAAHCRRSSWELNFPASQPRHLESTGPEFSRPFCTALATPKPDSGTNPHTMKAHAHPVALPARVSATKPQQHWSLRHCATLRSCPEQPGRLATIFRMALARKAFPGMNHQS